MTRCSASCGWPPGSAASTAPPRSPRRPWTFPASCARPPRPASCWPATSGSLLPLDRSGPDGSGLGRVALIGPNAEIARTLGGGSATVYPPYSVSPLDGLRAAGLDVTFAPGTLGHLRTAAARAPWLLRPDTSDLPGGARGGVPRKQQSPGADVRFFSPGGEAVGSERRDAAVFRWMNGFAAIGAPEQVDRLEVSCLIQATEAGTYQLGVTGIGRFRLLTDEAVLFDETLTVRKGADVGETLMAPPVRLAPLELAAGQAVTVRLEHDVHTSPMATFGTFFQLLLEPPHGTDDEEIEAAVALAGTAATWPWWWSAPPPRWRARASTAPRWRCPDGRTSSSARWPRPTRGPSRWSTPAPRSCCPGPTRWPRCC